MKKLLKRIIDKEITLSEMCDVSADVTRVLDDLFGSGSYTAMIRGNMTEPDGIDIRIDVGGVSYPSLKERGFQQPWSGLF